MEDIAGGLRVLEKVEGEYAFCRLIAVLCVGGMRYANE